MAAWVKFNLVPKPYTDCWASKMNWRKKGDTAFALLGGALMWPIVVLAVFDSSSFGKVFALLLAPPLFLIVCAALVFVRANRD